MEKLTPAYRSVLFSLWHKWNYFSKKGNLNRDGSFYYDDKRLASEQDVHTKTIMRARRFLKKEGHINYVAGACRGHATKYWILRKPDKKSPFVDISKPDNLSGKGDNLSLKAPQNVTPNKEITNEINKDVNNLPFEELKNGLLGLVKVKGIVWTRKFYLEKGYDSNTIDNILEGMS
jgi:hypothetical protein